MKNDIWSAPAPSLANRKWYLPNIFSKWFNVNGLFVCGARKTIMERSRATTRGSEIPNGSWDHFRKWSPIILSTISMEANSIKSFKNLLIFLGMPKTRIECELFANLKIQGHWACVMRILGTGNIPDSRSRRISYIGLACLATANRFLFKCNFIFFYSIRFTSLAPGFAAQRKCSAWRMQILRFQ